MTSLTKDAVVGTLYADTINYTNLNPAGGGGGVPISNPLTSDLDCNDKNVTNADNITCVNIDFTTSNPPIPTGFVNNPMTEELQGNGKNFTNVNDVGCASLTASGAVTCVGVTNSGTTSTNDLSVSGNTTIGGALTANGGIVGNGGLNIVGNETVSGSATVTNNLTVGAGMTCNGGLTINSGPNNFAGSSTFTGKISANGGINVTGNYVGAGQVATVGNGTFSGYVNCNRLIMPPATQGSYTTPVDIGTTAVTLGMSGKSSGALICYNSTGTLNLPVIKIETGVTNASKNGSLMISVTQLNSVSGTPLVMEKYRLEDGTPQTEMNVYITMEATGAPTSGNPIRINFLYIKD